MNYTTSPAALFTAHARNGLSIEQKANALRAKRNELESALDEMCDYSSVQEIQDELRGIEIAIERLYSGSEYDMALDGYETGQQIRRSLGI